MKHFVIPWLAKRFLDGKIDYDSQIFEVKDAITLPPEEHERKFEILKEARRLCEAQALDTPAYPVMSYKSVIEDEYHARSLPRAVVSEVDDIMSKQSGGTKHDSGKIRMELLSAPWIEGVAAVLTFGAKTYSVFGECSCHVKFVENVKSTLESFVALAMKNGSEITIQNMPPGKNSILNSGTRNIENVRSNIIENEQLKNSLIRSLESAVELPISDEHTTSAMIHLEHCSQDPATFAEAIKILKLITAIQPDGFAEDYAMCVISILDGLRKSPGLSKHSNTCGTRLVVSGDHNWRKGISQARLLGACFRHVFAYLRGEDLDPDSGLSHLLHASCCLQFAYELKMTHPELDDRYKIKNNGYDFGRPGKKP